MLITLEAQLLWAKKLVFVGSVLGILLQSMEETQAEKG